MHYRIVASRSTSRLVTCLGLFRLLMKGIFGPYVLWPLDKKLIFWIVTRVSARDYTVYPIFWQDRITNDLNNSFQYFRTSFFCWTIQISCFSVSRFLIAISSGFKLLKPSLEFSNGNTFLKCLTVYYFSLFKLSF